MSPAQQDWSDWINRTSMTSLTGLAISLMGVVISGVLLFVTADLLLRDAGDYFKTVPLALGNGSADEILARLTLYTAMANTNMQQAHNTGSNLAYALLAAWGLGKGINTLQHGKDRDTSREKINADAEARVTLNESAARVTKDRPAIKVEADSAQVNVERPRA